MCILLSGSSCINALSYYFPHIFHHSFALFQSLYLMCELAILTVLWASITTDTEIWPFSTVIQTSFHNAVPSTNMQGPIPAPAA